LAKNPSMHDLVVRRLGALLTTIKGKFIWILKTYFHLKI
jgi:hypothetical protein